MVAMETQTGGEIRTFFGYDRNINNKLAYMKKQMVPMSRKGHKPHK